MTLVREGMALERRLEGILEVRVCWGLGARSLRSQVGAREREGVLSLPLLVKQGERDRAA